MAPNPRIVSAFRAMKALGISEEKVKPVLKNLLKLYDKNWDLIEEDNYQVLADAIFEIEEEEAAASKKVQKPQEEQMWNIQPEEQPSKKLCLQGQFQDTQNFGDPSSNMGRNSMKGLKQENTELPELDSPGRSSKRESRYEKLGSESLHVSGLSFGQSKGKQPVSSQSLLISERSYSQDIIIDKIQQSGRSSESSSCSRRICYRNKVAEPCTSHVALVEVNSTPEKSLDSMSLQEAAIDPGIMPLPKQKVLGAHNDLKKKEIPFINDLSELEIPLSVIHPETSTGGIASDGKGPGKEVAGMGPSFFSLQSVDGEGVCPVSLNQKRKTSEPCKVTTESSLNLEIASSLLGDVKISFNCDPALGRPDFHVPSLDAVLRLVEDKCVKSYKVEDPNFSVVNVMKDMCECFLELGMHSSPNVSPA